MRVTNPAGPNTIASAGRKHGGRRSERHLPAVQSAASVELCLSQILVSTRSTVIVYSLSNCGRPTGDRLQTAEQQSSPVTLQPGSHAFLTAARRAGAGSQAEQLQSPLHWQTTVTLAGYSHTGRLQLMLAGPRTRLPSLMRCGAAGLTGDTAM